MGLVWETILQGCLIGHKNALRNFTTILWKTYLFFLLFISFGSPFLAHLADTKPTWQATVPTCLQKQFFF